MVTGCSRAAFAFVCGSLAITAGCDSKVRAKLPAAPPAPLPAAPQPLVLAQTTFELPSPQPVPPESVPPKTPAPSQAADNPVISVIQTPQRVSAPAKTKAPEPGRAATPEPAHTAPQPQIPAQTLPVPEQPVAVPEPAAEEPAAPLLSGEDLAISNARIQTRLNDLRRRVRPLLNSPNAGAKAAANRIESILRLADQQLKRGDLRQADSMADRAQTLLQELTRP